MKIQYGWWFKILAVILQVVSISLLMALLAAVFMGKINELDIDRWQRQEGQESYLESDLFAGQVFLDLQDAIRLTWLEQIVETKGEVDLSKEVLVFLDEDGDELIYTLGDIVQRQIGGNYTLTGEFRGAGYDHSSVDRGLAEVDMTISTESAAIMDVPVIWFAFVNDYAPDEINGALDINDPRYYDKGEIGQIVLDCLSDYRYLKERLKDSDHNVYYAFTGSVDASNGKKLDEIIRLGSYYRAKRNDRKGYYEEGGNIELFAPSGYNTYYGARLVVDDYYMMTHDKDALYIGVDTSFTAEDSYAQQAQLWQTEQDVLWGLLSLSPWALLIWGITLCYLIAAAGKTYRTERGIKLNFLDRIPFELLIILTGVIAVLEILVLAGGEIFYWKYNLASSRYALEGSVLDILWNNGWIATLIIALFLTLDYLWILAILLRLIRRKRDGSRCSLILTFGSKVVQLVRQNVRVSWQTGLTVIFLMLAIAVLAGFAGIALASWVPLMCLALMFSGGLLIILASLILIKKAQEKDRLIREVEQIAAGQLDRELQLQHYTGGERKLAEQIGHIRDGMENAVERAMKNERMKTELISNVSHDIRTPLTSIINYVDLLKREYATGNDPEHIKQYLEVLDQKSKRLKVLTEDLVEASKASSGVLQITPEHINLVELVAQVNGEFEERYTDRNLKLISRVPDVPVYIYADGRRIWRVLENLYQNVYKYAMAGTRVYVEVEQNGQQVYFRLKNISAEPLTVSAEELTERFVRGDESRSTEGSGLGLSIARSLVELQKGSLDIAIDGDLFRVTIQFPESTERISA